MVTRSVNQESYLTTSEAAQLFHVSPKTISRWSKERRLPHQKTFGGHRRYPESKLRELAASMREEVTR